jgi:hypothetical protein
MLVGGRRLSFAAVAVLMTVVDIKRAFLPLMARVIQFRAH